MDCDGIPDEIDEYPGCINWIDVDEDGLPDECDPLIDSDRDTVADDIDKCRGFNDYEDTDKDGFIDGCDPCVDADFDSVEDFIDQCPGFDDEFDKDGDGLPDGCDEVNDPLNEPPFKPILSVPPFTEESYLPFKFSTLTPDLRTHTFSDLGYGSNIHANTRWQISINPQFTWNVLDVKTNLYLTQITIPYHILQVGIP